MEKNTTIYLKILKPILGTYIILAILIVLYILKRKYPKQSKDFLNKIKSKVKGVSKTEEKIAKNIDKIPDWIRNSREKEKKK